MSYKKKLMVLIAMLGGSSSAMAFSDEEALGLVYGDMPMVTIATGNQVPVHKAPSTASVLSEQDIASSGAMDLDQLLERIPGLHVSKLNYAMKPLYSMRGILTADNAQVLMLINGTPINTAFYGDRSQIWGGMPVENIARIEVIRGPGSALYGADAFAGVINVITKMSKDIKGWRYGGRIASFNGQDAWLQYGGALGALDAAFYLHSGKTDGSNGIVEQDAQSVFDAIMGTSASLAPGPMSEFRRSLDFNMDLSYQAWRFRTLYEKKKVGIGAGLAGALDPWSRVPETRLLSDLSYTQTDWQPNWDMQAAVSYRQIKQERAEPWFTIFPKGVDTSFLGGGLFPDGILGNPGHYERDTHARVSVLYKGWERHQLRMGLGYREQDIYKILEDRNFFGLLTPLPGGYRESAGDPSLVYLQPHKRDVKYLFLQDEWAFQPDWNLTAGLRYDRYSDFGSTTNPRVALVWDALYNLTVKAMYGQAFRAPAVSEQHVTNNPIRRGNPDLQPERIATSELAFSWQASDKLHASLNLYRYLMQDQIRLDGTFQFNNTGDQKGHGFEIETRYKANEKLSFAGHFAWQSSEDMSVSKDAGLAPGKQLQLRADFRLADRWNLEAMMNHVADRKRQPSDTRLPIADYTTFDLNLVGHNLWQNWDSKVSVKNLFDENAMEPSVLGVMPSDLPMDRRAVYFQLEHHLD